MNQKTFLKSLVACGISIPYITSANVTPQLSELEDLYAFLESKKVSTPNGLVDFKLYPYQKVILKHMHENDKVLFVQTYRQVGMTTLLAGYVSWLSQKKNIKDDITYVNYGMYKYEKKLRNHFGKVEFDETRKRDLSIASADLLNFVFQRYDYNGSRLDMNALMDDYFRVFVNDYDKAIIVNANVEFAETLPIKGIMLRCYQYGFKFVYVGRNDVYISDKSDKSDKL